MALVDMQGVIADELARSDTGLTAASPAFITREINNAITFYQGKRFWFNENILITIKTIAAQRYYTLPVNFSAILNCRGQVGNLIYPIDIVTEQYIDELDWTNQALTNYVQAVSLYNGQIRIYPPPVAGVPIYIKGTVLLPTLTTTAATKTYAQNTAYSKGDTVVDSYGNIQTAQNAGTTQAAVTNTYSANTAYVINNTVLDLNGNTQKCTTAGTSGYQLAIDSTQWGTVVNGITSDGSGALQWTMTAQQWSTDYGSYTVDGSVVWKMTSAATNAWMTSAEELIRTRAVRMLYQRYIHDETRASSYAEMEREALNNLRAKNIGQLGDGRISGHL